MKKVLLFFLFLVMPLAVMADESDVIIGVFKYDLYDEGTAKLTKYQSWTSNSQTIPATVNYQNRTYSVTTIGYQAFKDCSTLNYITIPNSVTTIESWAFAGCSLYNVTIPESVTEIKNYTFSGCIYLSAVILPEGITRIGEYAFSGCRNLNEINFPSTLASIGQCAFQNCSGMAIIQSYIVEPFNLGTNAFSGMGSTEDYCHCMIYVPYGTRSAYIAKGWDTSSTDIKERNRSGQTLSLNTLPTMVYGEDYYSIPSQTAQGLPLIWSVEDESVAIISSTNDRLIIMGAGTTTVKATQAGNNEYQPFVRNFTLTVNKFPLRITAVNKTMEYGDAVPAYKLVYSGFVNGETSSVLTSQPTITCSATNTSNVGTYNIVVSGATASNYDITLVNGTLTINKAPLTITAKSYTINQKDDLPTFEVTYDGFKNAQTSSVLTTLPTITCDAADSETAGDFEITPSGAAATNYSFNYVSGTLTIDEVTSVSITLNSLGKGTYCSKYPLDFTNVSGIAAYIICGFKPSAGNLTTLRVFEVPAETGLYIVGTPGSTYNIPVKSTDFYYTSMMKGVTVDTDISPNEGGYDNYVLASLGNGGVIFRRLTSSTTMYANKAYVQIPRSTAGARAVLGIETEDDSTTGLDGGFTPDTKEAEGDYYNLSGQKVQKPQKGIYIKNGKKIIIH